MPVPYMLPEGRGSLPVLAKPRAHAIHMGINVKPGEVLLVSETRVDDDGVEYLELPNYNGWTQGDKLPPNAAQ